MHRKIIVVASVVVAMLAGVSAMAFAAAKGNGTETAGPHGRTTLQVAPETLDALVSLGVTPGAVAPAKLNGATYSFPITNSPTGVLRSGAVRHRGGISLSAGDTTVRLTDFAIALLDRRLYGKVNGAGPVALLDLDYSEARVRLRGRRIHAGPIGTTLTAGAAEALNDAFDTSALSDDTELGDVRIDYRLVRR